MAPLQRSGRRTQKCNNESLSRQGKIVQSGRLLEHFVRSGEVERGCFQVGAPGVVAMMTSFVPKCFQKCVLKFDLAQCLRDFPQKGYVWARSLGFRRDWLWFINEVGDNILSLADFPIGRYFY